MRKVFHFNTIRTVNWKKCKTLRRKHKTDILFLQKYHFYNYIFMSYVRHNNNYLFIYSVSTILILLTCLIQSNIKIPIQIKKNYFFNNKNIIFKIVLFFIDLECQTRKPFPNLLKSEGRCVFSVSVSQCQFVTLLFLP